MGIPFNVIASSQFLFSLWHILIFQLFLLTIIIFHVPCFCFLCYYINSDLVWLETSWLCLISGKEIILFWPVFLPIMNVNVILGDNVKSGSGVLSIMSDGDYSTYKFPNGTLLCADVLHGNPNVIRLMQNRNYHNTAAGLIAAFVPHRVVTYPPGFIPAKLVLVQGVHHAAGELKLIVNPLKFHGNFQ